jgi:hypothetical protein
MRTKQIAIPFILLAVSFLGACPSQTSIAKLNSDPGRFAGKEVTIAGRVSDSFGALGRGVFQVDDGTGTMWVLAGQSGVPEADAKVRVTGQIQQGFSFGGRNFATVLKETEPRH